MNGKHWDWWSKYMTAKKELDEAECNLFPWIRQICEVCTDIDSSDIITNIHLEGEADGDDATVVVNVDNWEVGPDTYYFPYKYLDMDSLDKIKADVEKEKKKAEKAEQRHQLAKEREEYRRLKEKFEKKK